MDVAELLAPIPGAAPQGRDMWGDRGGSFWELSRMVKRARRDTAEMARDGLGDAATARTGWAWTGALDAAGAILAGESKDLRVAGWAAEALIHRDGIGGLAAGLGLLAGLCTRYWEGLHPQSPADASDDSHDPRVAQLESP